MKLQPGHVLLLSLIPAFSAAAAQHALTVSGSVVDPSGAAIPGDTILLMEPSGKLVAHTETDSAGNFVISTLHPGRYTLEVPANLGFSASSQALNITADLRDLRIALANDTVAQAVDVRPDQTLSTDAAANRDTVSLKAEEIRKLPVFDQNIIATLTPFLDASSGSTGGVTIIVDGIERKNIGSSASTIQEVRINNDPYSAEFTRPGRGRIEVTTKPGSPQFHGETNFNFRDSIFNAKSHFAPVRAPETRELYEGYLSGPLGTDGHTSFIGSFNIGVRNYAQVVNAVTPTGPVNQNVPTPVRDYETTLRATHDFSPSHRFSAAYHWEYHTQLNSGVGGIVLQEAGIGTSEREDDAIFNDRQILSPNLINQLQVTFEKDESVTVSNSNAQAIHVDGSFSGGGAQADNARTENTVHINEVLTWSHGRHYLRFGAQAPQMSRRAVDDHTNRLGTFSFSSLADLNNGNPYSFTANQGIGRALYWINELGAFAQDQIKLTPRMQLSLGLRYDWQTYLSDNNNLAPRVSLSYAPGKGKTILRTGTGIFYDRTGGDFPSLVKLFNGGVLHAVQILNPAYPLAGVTNLATMPTSIARMDPHIRTPYSIQYSFGVEHQLHKTVTVTATYRGSVQVKSFRSDDINAPLLPPNPDLNANYARPNPNFAQVNQIESGGRAMLNALDVSFRGSAGRVFTGQAQYTLSRLMNNTGGIYWFPQNQYDPKSEWGRADSDQLQRFNLVGNINPDHWLTLGVNAALYSGTPYTETTGYDNFHTGLDNARPAGVGRNTLTAGGLADLDLLWNHDFKLTKATGENAKIVSAGLGAFDVLNRTNYTSYIGNLTSPLFGHPTASNYGRRLQFTLSYQF